MDNLKKIRLENKMSQDEVAKRLGITQQAYANYERGARKPDPETLIKLAELFDVTIDYLLGRQIIKNDPMPSIDDMIYERKLIATAKRLNKTGKTKLMNDLEDMVCLVKYTVPEREKGKKLSI